MDERRQYRTTPQFKGHISVTVTKPEGREIPGRVVDLSITGMGVFIHNNASPKFAVSDMVYLRLESPYLDTPIFTTGRIRRQVPVEEGTNFGIELIDWLGLLPQLPEKLKALFNQRGEQRLEIEADHKVSLEGLSESFRAEGTLHDLSPFGLCFKVSLDTEGFYNPGQKLRVMFTLPDDPEDDPESSLTFKAKILHSNWNEDSLYCGVVFTEEKSEVFQESQDKISRYIAEVTRKDRIIKILKKL